MHIDPSGDRDPADEAATETETAALERSRRRHKLDQIFGEVLPEATSDDLSSDPERDGSQDADLRRNVPPHHG